MNKVCFYDSNKKIWSGKSVVPIYNTEANLGYVMLQRLIQQPSNVFQISHDTGVELTNHQIYERSLKFANWLTKVGLKQNDVIGLVAQNSENLVPLIIACFTLGIAVNPLSGMMGGKDIVNMWSKIKPKVVFCDGTIVQVVKDAVDKIMLDVQILTVIDRDENYSFIDDILLDDFDIDDFVFPDLPNISSTTALIMCSSGTTGLPKGICKTHKEILMNFHLSYKLNQAQEIYFCSASMYWISTPIFLAMAALNNKKIVITSQTITPELWMQIIEQRKVTLVFCNAILLAKLLKLEQLKQIESLQTVLLGGVPFSQDHINGAKKLFPNATVHCVYGFTELGVLAMSGVEGPKGTSSGYPVRNTQVKIIDESENPLGPNETGEICCKTLVPFGGYYEDPVTSTSVIESSGFLKSGDIGYFDDDGCIHVIERIKHMINTKYSYRATPMEFENIINEIDGVMSCCVVGIQDKELLYDVIYAFVIKDETKMDLSEDFILNFVNKRVTEAKQIFGVHFMDQFPMTPSNKIMTREIKKIAAKIHADKTFKP